ncbi:hypothetical protein PC118_g8934 [Phytophthora cactorum]|uniref:RxLR effector protein n=1 Tax=Phytophthora cactorum TaxID=29920 RepID=A0A8T1GA22_9STRA|nr:hypothetical protein PC118_g8934 [Phytophthora cactorum]
MKVFAHSLVVIALLVAAVDGFDVNLNDYTQQSEASQVGQVSPASQVSDDSPSQVDPLQQDDGCTLSGSYIQVAHTSSSRAPRRSDKSFGMARF